MRMIKTTTITAAMLAAALALPASGWAAETPAAATPASHREAVEQRIADMHATLKITPAQEAIFNSFAQVMLDNAQSMQAVVEKANADAAKRTAEESLTAYATVAAEHAKNVAMLSGAFGTLYASLTPEQKLAADDMFRSAAAERQQKQETKTGG